jgi:hypothetical protein
MNDRTHLTTPHLNPTSDFNRARANRVDHESYNLPKRVVEETLLKWFIRQEDKAMNGQWKRKTPEKTGIIARGRRHDKQKSP